MFGAKNKESVFIVLVIVFSFILALAGIIRLDQKNRDIIRKFDLEKIQFALDKFYDEHGEYPPLGSNEICISLKNSDEGKVVEETLTPYLEKPKKGFPRDPKWKNTDKSYFYRRLGPSSFNLYAELERKEKNNNLYLVSDCSKNQNAFDYIISENHQITKSY